MVNEKLGPDGVNNLRTKKDRPRMRRENYKKLIYFRSANNFAKTLYFTSTGHTIFIQ